jgi:hypothetical protein
MIANERIHAIAYVLYLATWLRPDEDIGDLSDSELQSSALKWKEEWVPCLQQEHSGDCTNMPWSCTKCNMLELIKVAERILSSIVSP